jgi:hypothetical protein
MEVLLHSRSISPAQLMLLPSHTQPAEQLQAYASEGGGRSVHEPLTALAMLLQGLAWHASRSAAQAAAGRHGSHNRHGMHQAHSLLGKQH